VNNIVRNPNGLKSVVLARILVTMAASIAVAAAIGCSADDGSPIGSGGKAGSGSGGSAGATGGSGGSGGATGGSGGATGGSGGATGGSGGSGGATGGAGGSAGTNTGGSGGSGGASGSAGSGGSAGGGGSAGRDGGSAGSGGSAGRDGGGGGGGGGTDASVPPPSDAGPTGVVKASAGCMAGTGKPAGGKVTVSGEEIIDFPASYDGTKPFPLLIALHACGNPNTQWEGLVKGTAFETDYVRLMPNTSDSGQCWSNYANNSARILKQYDEVLAKYCVDVNHVFGVGHSSGAQMLVNFLSHKSDMQHIGFKAVSPVAADPYTPATPMPVLYIDGIGDTERSADSAKNAVARFRMSNGCADTSKPYSQIMGCTSQAGGKQVTPGCIIYDNCTVPTIWCAHNDPNYGTSYHGVPCFGVKAQIDFFKTFF
jgi:polyhydroxybutyrate depolymerase